MSNYTQKSYQSLYEKLNEIPDKRRKQGRRFSLAQILIIVIYGCMNGCENIATCHQKVLSNWQFFANNFDLKKIPDQTTIIRALSKIVPTDLIYFINTWVKSQFREIITKIFGLDGKTMAGIHNSPIRHILSLFGSHSHFLLAQAGIDVKHNEITAAKELLKQNEEELIGALITGDAIFATDKICQQIVDAGGDYIFRVKSNNQDLLENLELNLTWNDIATHQYETHHTGHGRQEDITVTISHDLKDFHDDLEIKRPHIKTIGRICKSGDRVEGKQGASHQTSPQAFEQTTYFISSREDLSPKDAYTLLTSHWSIENNLHRQKDMIYLEDRQTLRTGFAPQVMTFIRSLCLFLVYQLHPTNVAHQFRQFDYHPRQLQNYFRKVNII